MVYIVYACKIMLKSFCVIRFKAWLLVYSVFLIMSLSIFPKCLKGDLICSRYFENFYSSNP